MTGRAHFWSPAGALLVTLPFSIAPHGASVRNLSLEAALNGRSGTVSVTSDAPYGVLTGKTVALEPTTGVSFDSPMVLRLR